MTKLRVGHGYDVHRLVEGRALILGGVTVPFDRGLLGHSDADVLTHAVMDALLGAAALGDIGSHFPDSDPRYLGADSVGLLRETAELLNETRRAGGRIVCVGTTSCRTLESLVQDDGTFEERSAWTEIFIYPGYQFKAMDALITNFHLPESTLVMLVSAFAGREHVLHAYNVAVQERYRFFSFGDAMFIS